ncbi:MAG: hypothetical protein AB7I79_08940 [Rhizobiaceae bacterium]
MHDRPHFLHNSLIVGAHADDEMLWFGSIIKDVDRIVIVFRDFWAQPGLGERRDAALGDYPRAGTVCLGVSEAGAYACADWNRPVVTPHGIALGLEANRREMTRMARLSFSKVSVLDRGRVADASVARAYEANFYVIRDALRPLLSADMNVFTHNPWGEYGHEEHIQVFRVLQLLREEIGFKLWMSNYCTDRALPLAMRYFETCPGGYVRLPVDKAFAEEVASVYKRHDCWTWADDWTWFEEECFMEAPRDDTDPSPHRHLFPLNFFTIDPVRSRKWLPMALTMSVASAALGVALADTI